MAITVLLDLDDTILDFHRAEAHALARALTELGLEPQEETLALYSRINAALWQALERGEVTRSRLLVQRFEELFDRLGVARDPEEARQRYERYLGQGHWFIPGAPEMLEALDGRYGLYLVSNGNAHIQKGRLDSAGIRRYFRDIFVSEALGCNKPAKGFFDACFARIPDFDRERCIILGDSLSSDILGGINAGIRTCWFNPHGKPSRRDIPAEHEIRDLRDFPPLLEQIYGKA